MIHTRIGPKRFQERAVFLALLWTSRETRGTVLRQVAQYPLWEPDPLSIPGPLGGCLLRVSISLTLYCLLNSSTTWSFLQSPATGPLSGSAFCYQLCLWKSGYFHHGHWVILLLKWGKQILNLAPDFLPVAQHFVSLRSGDRREDPSWHCKTIRGFQMAFKIWIYLEIPK